MRFKLEMVISDGGGTDPVVAGVTALLIAELPPKTLQFLLGSRYCDTDLLSNFACERFGQIASG